MNKQRDKLPPALKHAAYSGMAVFPGEDEGAFGKLHENLIEEYALNGPSEDEIIETMARLIWRKKNLKTYHLAKLVNERYETIDDEVTKSALGQHCWANLKN